ncbi:hypothetical protein C2E23DRAFT_767284 [Lenzites betulinus]|nr:hypothetical protein C2E23DRAFT_767284 [Lenzites betulinus]
MSQDAFQTVYQSWLAKNPKDMTMLVFENRKIDLYKLHCEVIIAGGITRVIAGDQWPIIGARLGFVNIPGTDTEPARAGPALAHRLQAIYKDFLFMFDRQYYITMARRHHQQQNPQPNISQKQNMENALAGQSRPPSVPGGVAPRTGEMPDSKLMSELVAYSVVPAAELQRRGVAPNVIQLVEHNRVKLREMFDQQRTFHNGVEQSSQNQAGGVPQRNISNSMMDLPQQGAMPQQNGMSALGQPNPQQVSHQAGNHGMGQVGGMPQNVPQQQQQQQQPMSVNLPPGMMRAPMRPSPAQQQAAFEMVTRVKNECKNTPFPPRPGVMVHDTQRLEYNQNFEQLFRLTSELDQKLPHYACVMKEDAIRKLVIMVFAVQHQRELLSGSAPRYFLPLDHVKTMIKQVQSAAEAFKNYVMASAGHAQVQQGQQGPSNIPQRSLVPQIPHPPANIPAVPAAPLMPAAPATSPLAVAAVPPVQKKPTPKPVPETPSAPTPSASVATPAASAPTPTHAVASPQTPKSPRNKPKPKPQPKPRRVSKVQPSAGPSAASPSTDVKPPTTPATPASAPTPDSALGSKRPREEDLVGSSSSAAAAQPAAKKIKTEWDEPASDAQAKRQAEADAVKTDEDAAKFFEQMSSWLNQVSSDNEGQVSLKSEIATSLDEILKAYPDVPDDGGLSALAGSSFLDSITVGGASPKAGVATVDPSDFFDFSSYGLPEEDAGSKAATPDLVQASSSVGPSPGSASETEAHPPASSSSADTAKIADAKGGEPGEGVDAISQELYRAFDGGESAFYNASDSWKWDQPMPALEQPWAVFSS